MAAFSQALMIQDYDAVVDAYTDDAKIFPGRSKILTGKAAIRKYWTPPAGSNRKTTYHKIMPEEIKILGKEAYDYGYYEGKSIGNDGKESSWGGKYVITWKEVEPDVCKMDLDIWIYNRLLVVSLTNNISHQFYQPNLNSLVNLLSYH